MRRYLPILLMSFFILIIVLAGSIYLPGYADEKKAESMKNITVYTTLPVEQAAVLALEYEKYQSVRINVVPLAENDLILKLKTESLNPQADIVLATKTVLEQAKKNNLLEQVTSEQLDIIPKRFKDENNYWYGLWYDPMIFVVNKDIQKISPQIPTSWRDLSRDSKLRIGITDFLAAEASANLLYTLTSVNGETQTLAFLKKLHPQVVQYSKFLATPVRMVGMCEADVAIAVQSEASRYIKDSFPIKIVYPTDGTAYLLTGAGLVTKSIHKSEAKTFIDWLMQNNAQNALQKSKFYYVPTNPELPEYKEFNQKNIELLENKEIVTLEQKHRLLDKWIQTVRISSK
ncbi:MAG: extracellular solute-binding protein [Veillonellaceae bacterium]|nr:extracellular solute-binding protein [Veillonellaceae bacterium]